MNDQKDALKFLKRCKDLEIDEIYSSLKEILLSSNGLKTKCAKHFLAEGLYRARLHSIVDGYYACGKYNKFNFENEFWEAPAGLPNLGRCNVKGESLFYCSPNYETAIVETRPFLNSYVSIASFYPKSGFLLKNNISGNIVGFVGKQYLSRIKNIKNLFEAPSTPWIMEPYDDLDIFIDRLFHEKVKYGDEWKYKISNAITKIFMSDIYENKNTIKIHGLVYPSIVQNLNSYNFVFIPKYAKEQYYLKDIFTYKVQEETDDSYTLKLVRIGQVLYTFNGNGLQNANPINWVDVSNGDNIIINK